jgi:hypothetical protein
MTDHAFDSKDLIDSSQAAHAWINTAMCGFHSFDDMGIGAIALQDIPVSRTRTILGQETEDDSTGRYSFISHPTKLCALSRQRRIESHTTRSRVE